MDIIEGYIDYIKDKKIIREYSGIILYGYKKYMEYINQKH